MRIKLAVAIILLYAGSVIGQTASDIEGKYGKPINAYSVSEHVWMTPEYTADGQVCQMRLYPKRIASDTNYLSKKLPFEELKAVLNLLVPLNARGVKKESFGITATGGGAAWTTYTYEKVTFIFTSSSKVDPDAWKESKPYNFSVRESSSDIKPENTTPSDDDFFRSQASSAEIVTIKWNDRRCLVN
jgi:hypothetical protein